MQDSIYQQIKSIVSQSKTDNIFIIGKGPSIDSIDLATKPEGIYITLNDAERIVPGDFAVFSANWVRHSLSEDGFRSNFYLAGKPLPATIAHCVLEPVPLELDHDEMRMIRLESDSFYDEPFVLSNAIKLAYKIQRQSERPTNVYVLGCDFRTSAGSISKRLPDASGASSDERNAIIVAQRSAFQQLVHYFEDCDGFTLNHVGEHTFSKLTCREFNQLFRTERETNYSTPIDLANPDRVLIVAELTNNHLGDPYRLTEMVERAKEAGADLIKVQKRDVDSFYTKEQLASYYWSPFGTTLGDYRRGVELTDEMLELLDKTCKKNEIEWFCSVLDYPSYLAIKDFNPRLIKIPSTISNHRDYHQQIAADYRGAIVVSTGFTESEYVDHVLETYKNNSVIYLLHCISAYPTPATDCNIAVIETYRKLSNESNRIIPGYSSHDLGSLGCMLAVASGARMLEKHVKLGDVDWVHFDKVAVDLTTDEFHNFIQDVRKAESMIGNGQKRILSCEHHKYKVSK